MTFAALILFSACKKTVEPAQLTPTAAAPVKNEITLKKDVEEIPDEPIVPSEDDVAQLTTNFKRVQFDVDSYRLNEESKLALAENIEILESDRSIKLEIQGHADERGTTGYNLSLGHLRAQSVYNFILNHGITAERLKVISYGEERPLQNVSGETAWSQNRRCEFVILWTDNPGIKGTL